MASRVFAVELGAWSVKLAIASPGLRGATLTQVVERRVPPGDEPADVRARGVLASLIEELRLREESGYLCVSGDQVFTQVLEFGFKSLRRADLDKAVGGELEGVVPVDLEDMVYCFEPLPPAPVVAPDAATRGRVAPPAEGMRVLTYAMRRERAEALLDLARAAHFDPRGLLPCAGAAVRLVERTPSLAKARVDGAVAVIDVGHERTDVVVVSGGKAVFSRSLGRGGRQVTDAIARHWKLSFLDAEGAKHSDGFVASQGEPATSDAWAKIHAVTITELQPFARDLRQTLVACRARTGFQPLAAVVIGGGARLRGMGSFLTEQLQIPAWQITADDCAALAGPRAGGPMAGAPIDSAALTVGAAYDAAGGRPQFDLRSGALAVRVDLSFLRSKAVPLIASVVTIAAFAAGSAYAQLYSLRKSEKTLAARLATESTEHYGSARTVEEVLGETEPGGAGAGGIGAASPLPKMSAYDVLLEVSSHLTAHDKAKLDVDKLVIDDKSITLEGLAKATDTDPGLNKASEEVDAVYNELKKIECFKEPQRGTTDTEGTAKRFRFTVQHTCMTEGH